MENWLELQEKPQAKTMIMLTGWRQWADAGSVSSGLPQYLIEHTGARKIGEIHADDCYLFQMPGTHHLMRPEIRIVDGEVEGLEEKRNEFYYTGDDERGLVIFLGDEPHMKTKQYAAAFFDAVQQLSVAKVIGVSGVFASVPYDRERQISCIYSLPAMKEELSRYAVNFSNYEGGSSIGSYIVHRARAKEVAYAVFYAFVPAYDFAQSQATTQGVSIEHDYKAWYDLAHRFNHMLNLGLDLTDLQKRGQMLLDALDEKIEELAERLPQLNVIEYMDQLAENFTELSFLPLGDVWEQEFRHLFDDLDDEAG